MGRADSRAAADGTGNYNRDKDMVDRKVASKEAEAAEADRSGEILDLRAKSPNIDASPQQ